MTPGDRSRALEGFGYTPRQAQFLLLVALHGGHFLRRQYATFTGNPHPLVAVRFLAATTAREHVRPLPYGRHAHVYHLCARPLYAAIDAEQSRNYQPAEWGAVKRKLMTLDFVLARPDAQFWATEADKAALIREHGFGPDVWPVKRNSPRRAGRSTTARYVVDRMPWYREPGDLRLWFTYVDAESTLSRFEAFLGQNQALLAALPSGVAYVADSPRARSVQQVFNKAMGRAVTRPTFPVSSFLEYCRLRCEIEACRFQNLSVDDIRRFRSVRSQFAASSFDGLYARWVQGGDTSISSADTDSPAHSPSVLRVHELGFRYVYQSPARSAAGDPAQVT